MSDIADDTIQTIHSVVVAATDDIRQDLQGIKQVQASHSQDMHTIKETLLGHTQAINLLRQVQGSQSVLLRSLTADVGQIKEAVQTQSIFYEDLESYFTFLAENVSRNLTLHHQVQDHENRLLQVEAFQVTKDIP